jgi:flagellar biosynthesis/type III secretory pathway protein FliH
MPKKYVSRKVKKTYKKKSHVGSGWLPKFGRKPKPVTPENSNYARKLMNSTPSNRIKQEEARLNAERKKIEYNVAKAKEQYEEGEKNRINEMMNLAYKIASFNRGYKSMNTTLNKLIENRNRSITTVPDTRFHQDLGRVIPVYNSEGIGKKAESEILEHLKTKAPELHWYYKEIYEKLAAKHKEEAEREKDEYIKAIRNAAKRMENLGKPKNSGSTNV